MRLRHLAVIVSVLNKSFSLWDAISKANKIVFGRSVHQNR